MNSNATLKDCPLCGCAATFVKHSAGMRGTQGYDQWDAVACKHCRATVGACDRRFRSREDAATAWNLRTSQRPEQQAGAAEPVGWKELFWQVALALNCLPSSYLDGNEHVLRSARGEQGVLTNLLRECVGPLEVSAAIFESDDAEPLDDLIERVKAVLTAIDRRAALAADQKEKP